MVHEMGVAEEDMGKWSAAAEAVYYLAGAIASPYFAHLGDRYGRRLIYLLGLSAWGVGSVLFGLQRTLAGVIIGRFMRFAVFSPSNTFGFTIGPIIGGALANPVPHLLSDKWEIFAEYPYLLPPLATSAVSWIIVIVAAKYVPETRDKSIHPDERSDEDADAMKALLTSDVDATDAAAKAEPVALSTMQRVGRLAAHPPYRLMIILFALMNPLTVAFDILFPLFAYTSRELGGMCISVPLTGNILGASALLSIVLTIFLLPRLFDLLNKKWSMMLVSACFSLSTVMLPLIYKSHSAAEGRWTVWTVLLLLAHSVLRRMGDFSGTLLDALIVETLPSPDELAFASSLLYSLREITRAIGIYAFSLIFTISTNAPAGSIIRQVWWIILLVATIPAIWLSSRVEDRRDDSDRSEGEEREA